MSNCEEGMITCPACDGKSVFCEVAYLDVAGKNKNKDDMVRIVICNTCKGMGQINWLENIFYVNRGSESDLIGWSYRDQLSVMMDKIFFKLENNNNDKIYIGEFKMWSEKESIIRSVYRYKIKDPELKLNVESFYGVTDENKI